jgi:uncharacterized membrane protein YedE/YeeE
MLQLQEYRMFGFSPVSATIGGAFIGAAAGLLWIVNGRVAGVSSIFGMALSPRRADRPWRLLFLIGLPAGAAIGFFLAPGMIEDASKSYPNLELGPLGLAISGLLVGIGTGLARGCTSGHGVCGMARLSVRSMVAVLVFLAAAILTVYIVRHGP